MFQKSETKHPSSPGNTLRGGRLLAPGTMVERGATETSALLGGPSYARGPPERAGPSSAGKFRDVEEGVAPDVGGNDQHRRGRGLFARVVAGAALVVGCVALVGSGASRFHSTPMLGDASRHTERGDVAELSGNAPAGQQSKPRLLVAVISWQGGFEDTDAQERTWLPLLKDASPDIEVDYRVFIGRDFEKETDQETNAEAYRRRRMLRFDGEQTRRGPSVVTTGILPSNGDGGVGVDGVLGAGGAGGAGGSLSATAVGAIGGSSFELDFQGADDPNADRDPGKATKLLENYASEDTVIYKDEQNAVPETHEDRVVKLDVDDTYEGLPSKVVAAILWGTANDYDYFFKVDSDVFMMPTKFMAFLKRNAIDEGVDWMGSENKMRETDENPSGWKCSLSRVWHFGKCTRPKLNSMPYEGVNPVSVDGGHGYFLSKKAMRGVAEYVDAMYDLLEKNKFVNIYEDQMVSHILINQGFLPVDYTGLNVFKVPGITQLAAQNSCTLMTGELGVSVGKRLTKMGHLRQSTGINMYETIFGFTPMNIDERMLPRSLLEVGIQPYVTREEMLLKFGYWQRRMENEQNSMRDEAEELGVKLPKEDTEADEPTIEASEEEAAEAVTAALALRRGDFRN